MITRDHLMHVMWTSQEKPEVVVTPSEEMKETAEGATAAAKTEEQKPEEQVCVCVCVCVCDTSHE